MNTNFNRRDFVKKSAWGAATTLTLPAFLQQSLFSLDARAQTLPSPGENGPILIVVELGGGNDTLNTVIPFSNSTYQGARPNIALDEGHGILDIGQAPRTIGGSEDLALHPALTGLHQLWKEGDLAIVNGVGYPNPNLSHFTSFDYWHTARPHSDSEDGWIGRYFSSQCSGCDATQAIEFASRATTAFGSSSGVSPSVSFRSPEGYGWRNLEAHGRDTPLEELYRKLIGLDHRIDDGVDLSSEALSFVQRSTHNAMISTRNVRDAIESGGELLIEDWPNSRIARDLRQVAQLIRGGMSTSIYYVHQTGYDRHRISRGIRSRQEPIAPHQYFLESSRRHGAQHRHPRVGSPWRYAYSSIGSGDWTRPRTQWLNGIVGASHTRGAEFECRSHRFQ